MSRQRLRGLFMSELENIENVEQSTGEVSGEVSGEVGKTETGT